MPTLTHLALLDGGLAWHVVFETAPEDTGNIYYAFCQAIPLGEREAVPSAVGGGWRVQASAVNQRRLTSLLPGFGVRLEGLRRQGELFTQRITHGCAEGGWRDGE